MIHALPGLGADYRMYPEPWATLPEFTAHDWVRHTGETRLAEVAQSMCDAHNIKDGDILIGASLGGMVSCEIARIRRIPRLYLIGSAIRKEEVNCLLAALHPLAQVAPFNLLRFSAGKIPTGFAQMFAGIEASFVRAMCGAIFEWKGLGTSETQIRRLHGKYDRVIPAPEQADLLLDGGHLISITHAFPCVDYIRSDLAKPL